VSSMRDPVCGMPVDDRTEPLADVGGVQFRFCSEFCRQQFVRHPAAYNGGLSTPRPIASWAERRVAYFTMEIALENAIPTYSGGLGVLAGDMLRSSADLEVPVVAVSLVHRQGYVHQELRAGRQIDHEAPWRPEERLAVVEPRITVEIEGRTVVVRAWRYDVAGSRGYVVPVLLLDTDIAENAVEDRRITDRLYGGDERYRLAQEIVLGIGGVRLLEALGCSGLQTFHLNEGHPALAPLELLRTRASAAHGWDFQAIRNRTVFTTHTPVTAGHDRFDWRLVQRVLGDAAPPEVLEMLAGHEAFDMTRLALDVSHFVNGVALRHREVSSALFPGYEIHQITNGVHSRTWTSAPIKALFDRHMPGWRDDPMMLRNAIAMPDGELWQAHQQAKLELIDLVAARTGRCLSRDTLTIGFARRAAGYKRAELVVSNRPRLRAIAHLYGLQLVFAGKAHPRDEHGKAGIASVLAAATELERDLPIVYLEDYDLDVGRAMVSGCDLWLNTPQRPLEASGTSGMKAAHNGVPSLSVLDGWWREGHIEGVTGWSIGDDTGDDASDALDLYRKLEEQIVPMFYERRAAWVRVMKQAIGINASFFNTHRMVRQYVDHAYAAELLR
jgi:starch phosphorylase